MDARALATRLDVDLDAIVPKGRVVPLERR
jgi:hypothetical protein